MKARPGKHGFDDYGPELVLEADACVIGAGAGGSAAALALAEAGLRVVLVEEGRHFVPSDFKPESSHALTQLYQGRGARSVRGNVVMLLPGGRGVGGSTLINSAICFRTPPEVLAQWRDEFGCEQLTDERCEAWFDRLWTSLGVTVNPVAVQRNNNLIFRDGVEAMGLDGAFLARSAPGCVGCGICQYGCPSGGKASTDRTLLVEALATDNLGIYADCRATGVETSGERVVAVTGTTMDPVTQKPAGTFRVEAAHFVLSGGPIGSPIFLLTNGLADSTHCGQHLVVHPTAPVLARFEQEIRPWTGVTQGYYVDRWQDGFLLQTYTVTPDQYFMTLPTGVGAETLHIMKDLKHLASAGALVHDEDSEGRVRMTPAGPDLYYHFGDGDKKRLIEGLRLCAEVYFAAGAQEVYPGRVGAPVLREPGDIASALPHDVPASHLFMYASHPMGTCRMGADPAKSVIDPEGRVWGWSNLRVADASVFPTSLGVNPQITTMAMGLMVGESIASEAS